MKPVSPLEMKLKTMKTMHTRVEPSSQNMRSKSHREMRNTFDKGVEALQEATREVVTTSHALTESKSAVSGVDDIKFRENLFYLTIPLQDWSVENKADCKETDLEGLYIQLSYNLYNETYDLEIVFELWQKKTSEEVRSILQKKILSVLSEVTEISTYKPFSLDQGLCFGIRTKNVHDVAKSIRSVLLTTLQLSPTVRKQKVPPRIYLIQNGHSAAGNDRGYNKLIKSSIKFIHSLADTFDTFVVSGGKRIVSELRYDCGEIGVSLKECQVQEEFPEIMVRSLNGKGQGDKYASDPNAWWQIVEHNQKVSSILKESNKLI